MTQATITTKIHQTLDVHRDLAAEVTLNSEFTDLFAKAIHFAIGQFLDLGRPFDTDRLANLLCAGPTNAVDRRQSNFCVLVIGNIYAIRAM